MGYVEIDFPCGAMVVAVAAGLFLPPDSPRIICANLQAYVDALFFSPQERRERTEEISDPDSLLTNP